MTARVALLFERLGPYHVARGRSLGSSLDVVLVQAKVLDQEYSWEAPELSHTAAQTLFEDSSVVGAGHFYRRTSFALSRVAPQVVAVPGWSTQLALAGLKWCAARRVPAVVMSDSQQQDKPRAWPKEVAKRQIMRLFASALVAGSPHVDYVTQLGMPRERVFLGYDAVDNDYFASRAREVRAQQPAVRDRLGLPGRYFLACSRLIGEKNLPRLLDAYARYRELAIEPGGGRPEGGVWSLVLLGDGELRPELEARLARLRLGDCVQMPGFKQYDELPAYYGGASAFILGSTSETWGLVVNEAMASGLPVLVSNRCGCAPDLVREGENGFTFDPCNVEEMARGMRKVAALPPARLAEMGEASRRIVADWGLERFAAGFKAAVQKALEVGPIKPTLLQRAILAALLRR